MNAKHKLNSKEKILNLRITQFVKKKKLYDSYEKVRFLYLKNGSNDSRALLLIFLILWVDCIKILEMLKKNLNKKKLKEACEMMTDN